MTDLPKGFSRDEMAMRAAADIPDGWYVNLGVGIPTLIADHLLPNRTIILHSENGILGMSKAPTAADVDPWLVNAGKEYVTLLPGGSLTDQATSFAMIRGGHLDLCVLGAFEVSERGDLANWTLKANDRLPAVGGAMDLSAGAKRIWVMTDHLSRDGAPKIVRACQYPLTALGVVRRIYTNYAVIDVTADGLEVVALAPEVNLAWLQNHTEADLRMAA